MREDSRLEAIADYLETQGHGVIGRDIFVHFMPENVKAGVLLLDPIIGQEIDHYAPGYRNNGFLRLVVRSQTYTEGFERAKDVSEELNFERKQLVGIFMNYIRPRIEPVVFPNSKGDNLEFLVTFDVGYVIT